MDYPLTEKKVRLLCTYPLFMISLSQLPLPPHSSDPSNARTRNNRGVTASDVEDCNSIVYTNA